MPNILHFGASFSYISISRSSIPSAFPLLSLPPTPLPFQPALSLPKEVNNKPSYRRQNALSIIKSRKSNTVSEHTNVVLQKRAGVLHVVLTDPRMVGMHLGDRLVNLIFNCPFLPNLYEWQKK